MKKDLTIKEEENTPFFSVIIAVYNTEKYVRKCIESVLNQEGMSYEIIIVDDGSTDNSPQICDSYSAKYKNIKVIHQMNKGILLARRAGLKVSSGEYIVYVDSDDMVSAEWLNVLKKCIDKYKSDLLIYNYMLLDKDDKVILVGKSICEEPFKFISREEFIEENLKNYYLNGIVFKCANRNIIDIDEDYNKYGKICMGEDALQSVALLEKVNKIIYINKPIYLYRYNVDSISKKFDLHYVHDFLCVRKRIYSLLNNSNVTANTYEIFFRNYLHDFNRYIIRSLNSCKKFSTFYKFRQGLFDKEMEVTKKINYPLYELILYKLYRTKLCILFKPFFILYFKLKKFK